MEIKALFLESIKAFLEGRTIRWEEPVSAQEWERFFVLAKEQNVIPMVYQAVSQSDVYRRSAGELDRALRQLVYREVFGQVRRTQTFLTLYRGLSQKGLTPIVVKGVVLRSLYADGDSRPSSDEDVYIPEGSYAQYREALAENGMDVAPEHAEKEDARYEVSYCHRSGTLMIELHKSLFVEDDSFYQDVNEIFRTAFDRSILIDVDGVKIRTLGHSDHMLFLILHAFKHFLSGGFGVRQVCDMAVFANRYGGEIDWKYVYDGCRLIDAEVFAASLFEIGREHFGMDEEKAHYPAFFKEAGADPAQLLDDLLDAGIYGASDMDRKHSSSITLEAVAAHRSGKKARGLLSSLFPSRRTLQGRYGYLIKYPFLLPVAWVSRMAGYAKRTILRREKGNSAAGALRIGGERVELLRKYGIIRD